MRKGITARWDHKKAQGLVQIVVTLYEAKKYLAIIWRLWYTFLDTERLNNETITKKKYIGRTKELDRQWSFSRWACVISLSRAHRVLHYMGYNMKGYVKLHCGEILVGIMLVVIATLALTVICQEVYQSPTHQIAEA